MDRIVMTGGGTSGHVTPNLALIPHLKKLGYEIHYIGTEDGIERNLVEREGIPYHPIRAGKLRRYLTIKNVVDTFRVLKGFQEAFSTLRKLKPSILFSKGGFVTSPVVWAAYLNRIPIIIHESDMTPGLANKLAMPFADKICYTFPETGEYITDEKGVVTGLPVRQMLFRGKKSEGKKICDFSSNKPTLVVIGGSQGSKVLNDSVRDSLEELLEKYQVCHLCGQGGIDQSLKGKQGYAQFDYVNEELPHLFAMADLVISRAGATTIFELLALKKPSLLIPLSKKASRGDQILNANSFKEQGFSQVLFEEDLSKDSFLQALEETYNNRKKMIEYMEDSDSSNGVERVVQLIKEVKK